MDFRKIFSFYLFFSFSFLLTTAQVKKPTLMILPSDNWCIQRYFYKEVQNQGNVIKIPDYKKVFQEDIEIGQVISKIGSLMIESGFPLKDAENEIKNIERINAIDDATNNSSGNNELNKSMLDRILISTKSDVIIQIWWAVNKKSNGEKQIKFTLEAIDSYTNKRVSASTGIDEIDENQSTADALFKSIHNNISLFTNQIQSHFENLFQNGREVNFQVKVFKEWDNNLETIIQNKSLNQIIEEWFQANTVKSKYNIGAYTENLMTFEEVRIPLLDNNNRGIDARSFLRNLQSYLKNTPYNIPSKLISSGLGEAVLIIGDN